MARTPIVDIWAQTTDNKNVVIDPQQIKQGIVFQSEIVSNNLNGIFYTTQSAIRDLQIMGGFYDNSQTYMQNNFVNVLVNVEGQVKNRVYLCTQNNTKQQKPVAGTETTVNDVPVVTPTSEDSQYWKRVIQDNLITKKSPTLGNNKVVKLYETSTGISPRGTLKVRVIQGTLVKIAFDIVWYGVSYRDFKICNVCYSSEIKLQQVTDMYGGIFYSGWGLVVTNDYFAIGRCIQDNMSYVEVDCEGVNFAPSLVLLSTFPTPHKDTAKIYAIREGGGSDIQGMGVIYPTLSTLSEQGTFECKKYYLFKNGFVSWGAAITLDPNFFHQYDNVAFAQLNQDPTDRYIVNAGVGAPTPGIGYYASLPNIKGTYGLLKTDRQPNTYFLSQSSTVCSTTRFTVLHSDCSGCISVKIARRRLSSGNPVQGYKGEDTDTRVGNDFYYTTMYFDANKDNPIYKDGAGVEVDRIATRWAVRVF